ncbi:MAG TPA: HIT family protein [Acidimicrobiia bacterium]|jgi:histidine triad (HIT) family protein|nr:HIT family protein [Acidimicrobiia bacterium]
MATIFTRIIEGEIPGTFVWRDERCVAFMSINPLRRGHTLVVPIEEIDHWIDCPDDLRDHLFGVAQVIARAQQAAFQPTKVGLMIAGLEVPHLHLHVVPIDGVHDLDFSNAAATVDRDELEAAAAAIRDELRAMGADGVT